jgi:hypothetical protein
MVPHYDELMRRPVAVMMTEAAVHAEPAALLTRVLQLMANLKWPQRSGYRPQSATGWKDLSRGSDTRAQRGEQEN